MYSNGWPRGTSLNVFTNLIFISLPPTVTGTSCPRSVAQFQEILGVHIGDKVSERPVSRDHSGAQAAIIERRRFNCSGTRSFTAISGPTFVQSSPRAMCAPTGEKMSRP